jgi:hypothetical protein
VLADVNVSLPLGSANRELIRLVKDSGAGPVASRDVSRSSERIESTETMEGVLEVEGTGEMRCSLAPQETM